MVTRLMIGVNILRRAFPPRAIFPRSLLRRPISDRWNRLLLKSFVHPSPAPPRSILVHCRIVRPGATIRPELPVLFTIPFRPVGVKFGSDMLLSSWVIVYSPQPRWVDLRCTISRCPVRRLLAAAAMAKTHSGYVPLAGTIIRAILSGTAVNGAILRRAHRVTPNRVAWTLSRELDMCVVSLLVSPVLPVRPSMLRTPLWTRPLRVMAILTTLPLPIDGVMARGIRFL